jgi:nucleoside-diphosphate-sugar epimerase
MEERVVNAKQRDFHPTALRIATCHGFSPRMRFDLVPNTFMRDAICEGEIEVEGGAQWRAMIHVSDTARAFVACINAHENLVSGEVFNVAATEHNMQIKQLANLVASVVPETKISIHDSETDLPDYRLSCAKIEKILDFAPKLTMEDSLNEMRQMLQEEAFGNPYRLKYLNT